MNVREGNCDDEIYLVERSHLDFGQHVDRKPKRPKSGLKRTLVGEYEDEAVERKATARKQSLSFGDFPSRPPASCVGIKIMLSGRISKTVPSREVITNTC